MSDPSDGAATVIRVFPDYADSVIWFIGPVLYEQARITLGLIEDLSAWEDQFYKILDDQHWIRDEFRDAFDTEGLRLAQRLSEELGPPFAVDYVSEKGRITRCASTSPGTNPAAVAAFIEMADDLRARTERLDALLASGAELHVVPTKRRIGD